MLPVAPLLLLAGAGLIAAGLLTRPKSDDTKAPEESKTVPTEVETGEDLPEATIDVGVGRSDHSDDSTKDDAPAPVADPPTSED